MIKALADQKDLRRRHVSVKAKVAIANRKTMEKRREQLEFIRLVCMLVILSEMKRKTVTLTLDKLSFKNILD